MGAQQHGNVISQALDVLVRCAVHCIPEFCDEIAFVQAGDGGEGIQRQLFPVMLMDVCQYTGDVLVESVGRAIRRADPLKQFAKSCGDDIDTWYLYAVSAWNEEKAGMVLL